MEFSSNVHLHSDNNDRYQLIYTSQNYGTFYGVFGKFSVEAQTLKKVDLKLINFKGEVNLGIYHAEFIGFGEEDIERLLTEGIDTVKCGIINLHVRALEVKKDFTNINISCNLEDLKDHYLSIRRSVVPINKECSEVFDTEYYYRDGLRSEYEFSQSYLDYKTGFSIGDVQDIPKGPGGICPKGLSKIII